jgi:hypothetical protein
MRMLCSVVAAGVVFLGSVAFAAGVKVVDSQGEYVAKIVTADGVKGVEVRLAMDVSRDDCNTRTIDLTNALVSGDGAGWHDKYFMDARMTQTKMHCPLDKPVKETIHSQSVFLKSFTNENLKGRVVATMIIPKGYTLEVVVAK